MKKKTEIGILLLLAALLVQLCACGTPSPAPTPEPTVEPTPVAVDLPDPWHDFETLEEAEAFAGFSCGFPRRVAVRYRAVRYRATEDVIEILYQYEEDPHFEVVVRKSDRAGRDISGDYNHYNAVAAFELEKGRRISRRDDLYGCLDLVFWDDGSYSFYAQNGYPSNAFTAFLNLVVNPPQTDAPDGTAG